MKKIIIAMMATVSLLNFSGRDSLDMEPVGGTSDANYWKPPDQFKAFSIGSRGLLRSQSSYNIFVLGEPRSGIYGDQPFGGEATQGVECLPYNTINTESTGISDFVNFYTTLNQINLMIRRTNETDLLGEVEKNHYLGQVYGLRTYTYFHLLRSWGNVIITIEPTLGSELDISRLDKAASPANEVTDLVEKDIDASGKAFGGDYSYEQGKCHWSKSVTLMLRGEVYLRSGRQMGGSTDDCTVARIALQDLQQNGNLKLRGELTDVSSFNNEKNSEVVFALHNGKEDDFMMWRDYNWRDNMVPQCECIAGYCDETGAPFLEIPGYNLQDLTYYQVKEDHYLKSFREGGTRLRGTLKAIYRKHKDGTLEYVAPIQYKFQGTTLEGSSKRSWYDDYPIYRYAGTLLLLAEAKALLGEDPSTEINATHKCAYSSECFNAYKNEAAYPSDKGSFYNDNPLEAGDKNVMKAIPRERLCEFFFEDKHWYDLRHFGKDYVLKYATVQESRLLWPISEGALTDNSASKQTPGY